MIKLKTIVNTPNKWFQSALFYFLISSLLGLLLRFSFVSEIRGFNFKYFLHAHSHAGILGWLFAAFYVGIFLLFNKKHFENKTNHVLFWGLQFAVFGMLLSFPFQGYALYSIIFSTIHLILTYMVVFKMWKTVKFDKSFSALFLKTAIALLILSSFGIWFLPPVIIFFGREDFLYHLCIEFFLHFQLSGWFIFAGLAIIFRLIERKAIHYNSRLIKPFYYCMLISTIFIFTLNIPSDLNKSLLVPIKYIGTSLQIISFIIFFIFCKKNQVLQIISKQRFGNFLIFVISTCIWFKIIFQFVLVFIQDIEWVSINRYLIVGFIHLLLLGILSLFIGQLLYKNDVYKINKLCKLGWLVFITGFIFSEFFIFLQGMSPMFSFQLPNAHELIFYSSIIMPLGILLITISVYLEKTYYKS